MAMEGYDFSQIKKNEKTNPIETSNQVIIEKLDSLGVNYKSSINGNSESEYTFFNVLEEGSGVFSLDAQGKRVIFQTLHFDENNFKHPDNKKNTISPKDLLTYTAEKFPDADEIIYSCCNPEEARKKINSHLIIGSGFSEYRTVYNSRNHSVTVSPSSS
jgi:hypothetical protein